MADIFPFRGLRYNPDKLKNFAEVVIPPYDVISPAEQELFLQISPYNMVHLELGRKSAEDSETNNPHTRAGRYLREWQDAGVLIREEKPALYYYELDYPDGRGEILTRHGFICLLRLEDFSSGRVRPHEKTFQAVKAERLGLMLASNANLSPVFALYSDPELQIDRMLQMGREADPIISFVDCAGMSHRLWRVMKPEVLAKARSFMMEKPVFIADGHHRYETALNYRAIQRQRHGENIADAPYEFIMMYLSNMDRDGLTILPTHRLLRNLPSWNPRSFLHSASDYFEIDSFEDTQAGKSAWMAALENGRTVRQTFIGLYWPGADSFYLLRLKVERAVSFLAGLGINPVLQGLDVVVLDQLVLRHLLGLSNGVLGSEQNIYFRHDAERALLEVKEGSFDAGFFINPTRLEQVREVASAGLIMPHKATYFYPKVWSGLVINLLSS